MSQIKLEIHIDRFEQDLYQQRKQKPEIANIMLSKKYGYFYQDFINQMVGTPELAGPEVLKNLYQSKAYSDLNHEVDSVFPKLKSIEDELTTTFKYIKYYYPKTRIPRFISFISGFAYQIPIGENYMGIGLDMFLGKNSKFYPALVKSIPKYQSNRFTPAYIVPRLTEEFVKEEILKAGEENQQFLNQIIYQGKILYFLDQVLPEATPDSIKIGYTGKQFAWAKRFEGNIWAFMLEKNLIYETDFKKYQPYISDGPFTPGLGDRDESAPKLGIFIGWQIVRRYMEENPKLTLQQLMLEQDAQKILNTSKYKPKIQE